MGVISIDVRTLSGHSVKVNLDGDKDDESVIKECVFNVDNTIPVDQLKLVYYGKALQGVASSWGIPNGSVVIALPDLKDPVGSEVELDLVFVVDCTGSMSSYIHQAQTHIFKIIEEIIASERASVRFALVKYKDMSDEYITKVSNFTDDLVVAKQYVDTMSAGGGGDAPEAVASGLKEVLSLDYRPTSTKVCVLIADAPPHGLEAAGDSHPDGDKGTELLDICRQFVPMGIRLYSVGCEPSITGYPRSCSWMKWAAEYTGGKYISLLQASALATVIVGGCREQLNRDKFKANVIKLADKKASFGDVTEKHCEEIADAINKTGFKLVVVSFVDTPNPNAFSYVNVFDQVATLAEAKQMCANGTVVNTGKSLLLKLTKMALGDDQTTTTHHQSGRVFSKLDEYIKNTHEHNGGNIITTIPVNTQHVRCVLEQQD